MLGRFRSPLSLGSRLVPGRSSTRKRPARRIAILEPLESRDLLTLTWTAGAPLPVAEGGVAALSAGTSLLVLGGPATTAYNLGVTDPAWNATVGPTHQPLDFARTAPGVGPLPNGYVLVFGGAQNGVASNAATQYDPNGIDEIHGGGGNFTQSLSPMNTPRARFGWASDASGLSYAIGGLDDSGTPLSSMEVYDPGGDTWTNLAALPRTLSAESAVGDGAGHLFTFGGIGADGSITSNVDRYTIATHAWDQVASLPVGVRDSSAVLAPNGLIYVLGGKAATGTTAAVQSYDPATNTWKAETPLPAAVSSEAAVVDALGRIEVVGGLDAQNSAMAAVSVSQELSQPATAPTILSSPSRSVVAQTRYSYQVAATGNPQATFALATAPAGMSIDPNTGLLTWAPTFAQEGAQAVTVQASNAAGQASQTFSLNVVPPVPTGLKAAGASTTSIALAWDASADPSVSRYNVYERTFTHSPRGSGGSFSYRRVAAGVTTSTFTVSGLKPSTVGAAGHTYLVTAVDGAGLESTRSAVASAQTLYAPILYGAMTTSGAVVSSLPVAAGQSVQVDLLAYGNEAPTFSVATGPKTVSVDPTSGLVTYKPGPDERGTTVVTFRATNSVGTSTNTFTFVVLAVPTLTLSSGSFAYDGTAHAASATAVGSDGVTSVSGTFTYTYNGSAVAPTDAGRYAVVATFTSSDRDYASTTATGTLTIGRATPVFRNLASPLVRVGTSSTTLSGILAAATVFPTGDTVSITLRGVTQRAIVDASGHFTVRFATSRLTAGIYAIRYVYGGDSTNLGAAVGGSGSLIVGTVPKVTRNPLSRKVVAGRSVTFTAAAMGSPTPTVQWQVSTDSGRTWTGLAAATSTRYNFMATAGQNASQYRAVFTNGLGKLTTKFATLTVLP